MAYIDRNNLSIQSTPFPGALTFPDEFMPIYYPEGKRAAGFVTITDDGHTVTSCVWDEEAYQAWAAENPEQPETEPTPTLDDRVTTLEGSTTELYEALDMILSGVTE